MVSAAARHGYLPMALAVDRASLLLVKCHLTRMVLRFHALHRSRSVRRRARKEPFVLSFDTRFDEALHAINRHHAQSWLTPGLRAVFEELHHAPCNGVSLHSVEVRDDAGRLAAAEVGYRCGRVYTSLSGFHRVSGAGTVQMVALARVLTEQGFAFWDMGMDAGYKRELGAHALPREAFLTEYRRAAGQSAPIFPAGRLDCATLVR